MTNNDIADEIEAAINGQEFHRCTLELYVLGLRNSRIGETAATARHPMNTDRAALADEIERRAEGHESQIFLGPHEIPTVVAALRAPVQAQGEVEIARSADNKTTILARLSPTPTPTGQSEGGWRPISEAPKDGTLILVSFGTLGVFAVKWTEGAHNDWKSWCVDDLKFGPYPLRRWCEAPHETAPTHWQPLPSSPAQGEQQ